MEINPVFLTKIPPNPSFIKGGGGWGYRFDKMDSTNFRIFSLVVEPFERK